jgi:hypothetical protein
MSNNQHLFFGMQIVFAFRVHRCPQEIISMERPVSLLDEGQRLFRQVLGYVRLLGILSFFTYIRIYKAT